MQTPIHPLPIGDVCALLTGPTGSLWARNPFFIIIILLVNNNCCCCCCNWLHTYNKWISRSDACPPMWSVSETRAHAAMHVYFGDSEWSWESCMEDVIGWEGSEEIENWDSQSLPWFPRWSGDITARHDVYVCMCTSHVHDCTYTWRTGDGKFYSGGRSE